LSSIVQPSYFPTAPRPIDPGLIDRCRSFNGLCSCPYPLPVLPYYMSPSALYYPLLRLVHPLSAYLLSFMAARLPDFSATGKHGRRVFRAPPLGLDSPLPSLFKPNILPRAYISQMPGLTHYICRLHKQFFLSLTLSGAFPMIFRSLAGKEGWLNATSCPSSRSSPWLPSIIGDDRVDEGLARFRPRVLSP